MARLSALPIGYHFTFTGLRVLELGSVLAFRLDVWEEKRPLNGVNHGVCQTLNQGTA